jgi:hypothetical protein
MQDQITVDGKDYRIKPVLEKYFTIYHETGDCRIIHYFGYYEDKTQARMCLHHLEEMLQTATSESFSSTNYLNIDRKVWRKI